MSSCWDIDQYNDFPQARVKGIKILTPAEGIPTGMEVFRRKYYDLVSGKCLRVAFDKHMVTIIEHCLDFGDPSADLTFLGFTGLGGCDLYYKAVSA